MSSTDRAIRVACQAIVILWIAAFLGWRDIAPREVRVAVKATPLEARELPPAPLEAEPEPAPAPIAEADPEPEPIAETDPEEAPLEVEPPEPEQVAEAGPMPEPEPPAEPMPEPEPVAEIEPTPEPQPQEIAEAELPPEPPPPAEPIRESVGEPEPIAAAGPAPLPMAEAPAAPAEAPLEAPPLPLLEIDEADVAHGGTLLAGDAGFPALESRYEGYGSFREYAHAMQRLGAKFVIVNRREIVATIDPWTLETGALGNPGGLSPRARDFTSEPELVRASRAVRRQHGVRAEVMMLVPRRVDAGLFGGIARALEARGGEAGAYRQIRAHYERGPGGALHLRVEAAVRRDGGEDPLPLLFDLDGLARGSRV